MPNHAPRTALDRLVTDERRHWVIAHLQPDVAARPSPALPVAVQASIGDGDVRPRAAAVALAVVVLLSSGIIRRRLTDDAGAARTLAAAAARVPLMLPATAGTWSGPEVAVDRRGLLGAGIVALAARRYVDSTSGAAVTAVLLCGRPGPIAAHGPESCYPGVGYAPVGEPRRDRVPGLGNTFWSATFSGGSTGVPRDLNVCWAWADRDGWSAPDNPRLRFAPASVLFKLYLLHEPGSGRSGGGDFPPLKLAADLLPSLDVTTARQL